MMVINASSTPFDNNQKKNVTWGTWHGIARLSQGGWGQWLWLVADLAEGSSDNKHTGKVGSSALIGKSTRRGNLQLQAHGPRTSF